MSAYSERDLAAAFDCAEERTGDADQMRGKVMEHLVGDCTCKRDRCPKCGERPRNGIPRHKPGCAEGPKRI